MADPLIIRLIRTMDMLDPERLEELIASPDRGDATFEESVIRSGLVDEGQIARAYAGHYLMPVFDPPADSPPPVDPTIATVLPNRLCREHLIAPLSDDGRTLEVALFAPDSLLLADEIKLLTGRQMKPLFAPLSVIERLLNVLYDEGSWTDDIPTATVTRGKDAENGCTENGHTENKEANSIAEFRHEQIAEASPIDDSDSTPSRGPDEPVMRYVNAVLEQALQLGATDIHIEPYEQTGRVRLRVDGVLSEITPPPMPLLSDVITRLKELSKMDVAERGLPQDGSIELRSRDRRIEMRVNTCPTVDGEKMVMRVRDRNALPHDLTKLGLDARQLQDLVETIRSPQGRCHQGLALVTGPAGCGKSTTLYSCLNELNNSETSICTVEDPVEFKFAGMNQVETRTQTGFNFASALGSCLRQDPDVIMVDEVRDGETAEICVRAALTGRFVFSTLHASDALTSITRLKDMGIDPLLVSDTIRMLVAQRLVRRLCGECKQPYELNTMTAERFGVDPHQPVFRANGCSRCRETGYRGRLAVFEVVRINPQLREMIQSGATIDTMKRAAVAAGVMLLGQSVAAKVGSGETSVEEALRACADV